MPLIGGPSTFGGLISVLVVLPIVTSVVLHGLDPGLPGRGTPAPRARRRPDEDPTAHGSVRSDGDYWLAARSVVAFGPLVVLVGVLAMDHDVSRFAYVWHPGRGGYSPRRTGHAVCGLGRHGRSESRSGP